MISQCCYEVIDEWNRIQPYICGVIVTLACPPSTSIHTEIGYLLFSDFISKQKIPIYSQIFINKFNYKLPLILIGRVGTCTRARADKRCLLIVRLGLVHLSLELSIAIPILRMDLDHQIKERTPQ